MNLDHVPAHVRPALLAANADKPLVKLFGTSEAAAQEAIRRYKDGEAIGQIAESWNISPERVYIIMYRHVPEEWQEAQIGKSLRKLEESEEGLETAADSVSVGRARERARLACWRLERVARKMYAPDAPAPQVSIQIGAISDQIQRLERELQVDGAPLQLDQPSDQSTDNT